MSDFNYQPAYGVQVSRRPRVNSSRFGDGYDQRSGDGINNQLRAWQLTFTRQLADIDAIEQFLSEQGGVDSFSWTYRGEEVRVLCREWSSSMLAPQAGSLSCTFEEVPA